MSLLYRFVIATAYIIVVIISAWILENIIYFQSGFNSYQIIEQLQSLSITQLQAVLGNRGISQDAMWEKSEIIKALQNSGPVHYAELECATYRNHTKNIVELSGYDEFYEQLSEETESIWLIEIIPDEMQSNERILNDVTWLELKQQLHVVGINTAVLQCSSDKKLCDRYGWKQPQLVVVIPKFGYPRNFYNLQCTSKNRPSAKNIISWLHTELAQQITRIETIDELEKVWLNRTVAEKNRASHMILFTNLLNPPLLLVTLGLRFSSRIRFGVFKTDLLDNEEAFSLLEKYNIHSSYPGIVFTSSSGVTPYGYRKGESVTEDALDAYVRLTQPRINDFFSLSMLLVNVMALLGSLSFKRSIGRHFVRTFLSFPLYNIALFLSWMAITAVLKFSVVKELMEIVIRVFKFLASPAVISNFLYYISIVQWHSEICLFAFVFLFATCYFVRDTLHFLEQDNSATDAWNSFYNIESYMVNLLFRPIGSLSHGWVSQDYPLEDGMELLIERLATPDLWLHPLVPKDYVQRLSLWRYDGWGNEDDLKSESETDLDSVSETECEKLLESHTCCQEANCKMCMLWATVKETYVCHRCAIVKRRLEKQYLRLKETGDSARQHNAYEKLLKVCENCLRTRKVSAHSKSGRKDGRGCWPISVQRLMDLRWTAPPCAIETRTCVICLDRYRWSAVLCGLPCGHTFHHSCIMEWLHKDHHHCPTCRWPSYKTKDKLDIL